MKYLVTAQEMKRADKRTSTEFGMDSLVLMERAAMSAYRVLQEEFPQSDRYVICCGYGNNGGDGLALARMLFLDGRQVSVFCIGNAEHSSDAFSRQLQTANAYQLDLYKYEDTAQGRLVFDQAIMSADCVVDAIFGVGLNRSVEAEFASVIERINARCKAVKCMSLDIPSGIHTDTGKVLGIAVKADLTVTFAFAKLGLVCYPGKNYAGKVILGDAGITAQSFGDEMPRHFTYEAQTLKKLLPKRIVDGNKGTFGKVLVVAGSYDMAGAAVLSARAAFYTGVGMVKLVTCAANRVIIQNSLPEAMLLSYEEEELLENKQFFAEKLEQSVEWADSIVVGPGLSKSETAGKLLKLLLELSGKFDDKLLVADADALNLLAEHSDLMELLGQCRLPKILTPHLGELSRLCGISVSEVKRDLENAVQKLRRSLPNMVLVCKDARTAVFDDRSDRVFLNTLGNDGMATAGSGDVLAGLIGGIGAQRSGLMTGEPFFTACIGVTWHGELGDRAAEKYGKAEMMAGDLIGGVEE